MKKNNFEVKVYDHELPRTKWLGDYRVTCKVYESGAVVIVKIERFHEMFQVYSDITTDVLWRENEIKELISNIQDWNSTEEYLRLPKPKHA